MFNRQFIQYAMVGVMGTIVHYCVLLMLHELFFVATLIATTVGAIAGAGVNYALNYIYTFKSKQPHQLTMIRFFIVALLGLLLNYVTMAKLQEYAAWHYLFSQILATLMVLIMGYFLNKYWTFGQQKPATETVL